MFGLGGGGVMFPSQKKFAPVLEAVDVMELNLAGTKQDSLDSAIKTDKSPRSKKSVTFVEDIKKDKSMTIKDAKFPLRKTASKFASRMISSTTMHKKPRFMASGHGLARSLSDNRFISS